MADEGGGGFLKGAYALEDPADTRALYKDWAASYEAEVKANGYVTPQRCARALADAVTDLDAPLLDLGCGTGLSGEAFRAAGFATIDGSDFSREMLDHARGKAGVYRRLTLGDLNRPIPARAGEYANAAAVGVFSPGHAPAELMDAVLALLPAGGCFVFSLNDHALADASYRVQIDAITSAGTAEVAFEAYGEHLPGVDLKASVYVLHKP